MKCPKCHFENPQNSNFCGKCATPLPYLDKIPTSRTETIEIHIKELTEGSIFAGRYEIIKEIGSGGMGRVYHVFDKEVKEEVALKLLRPEISGDEDTIERFRNELKFARKISHRNVCRMYDLNREEETQYITMEFVHGEDLKSMIRSQEKLNTEKAILLAKQVCEGLAEAHRLGVVHRDLKPQNIMIDKEGDAHILDFGIARFIKAEGITLTGMMIGTPDYMSPEQVEGENVDQRSDIYSLGVVLYEMVTGRVPFKGKTPLSTAIKHKTEPAPNPINLNAQLSEEVSRIILKCMEKDKIMRYQRADELLADLVKIEKGLLSEDSLSSDTKIEKDLLSEDSLSSDMKIEKDLLSEDSLSSDMKIEKDLLSEDSLSHDIKFDLETPKKHILPIILFLTVVSIVAGYFFYNQILRPEKKEKEEKSVVISEKKKEEKSAVISEKKSQKSPLIIPQLGSLDINSSPRRADVYINSKREGVTPLKRDLKPGTYKINIKKNPEYKEITDNLYVKAGETYSKNYTLNLVYILDIKSDPKGADVKIDGNYKGKTPIRIELSKRRCRLRVEKSEEWSTIDKLLTFKPGLNSLKQTLRRIRGIGKHSMTIATDPPGANVYVENTYQGVSPLIISGLDGVYNIKVEKEGCDTIKETVVIKTDGNKYYILKKK